MKIESFERAEDDSVVAVCNGVRHVLPWSFVIDNKPQVGDFLHEIEGLFVLAKEELIKVEEAVEAEPEVPPEPPVEPTI